MLSQIRGSFTRSMRIFLRDKAIIGSSIMLPIFFLIVLPLVLFQNVPAEVMPATLSFLVIAMITLLIMSTAISNLPGSIAADRDKDLYSKLASMPVHPLHECVGRIITVFVFSALGSIVILLLGFLLGAQFMVVLTDVPIIIAIASVITLTSAGIGLIIAGLVESESAAAHVGVAIVMFIYFMGIAFPYSDLPVILKPLVHLNPICLGNNMIGALAIGEEFIGYNPFNVTDLMTMLTLTGLVICVGMHIYSKYCWMR
ncbi:MAG: ABC transporter permease [Candidatus Thorarchaeota archaeon]